MKVVNDEAAQRFEIRLDDGSVAFAEYRRLPGAVVFPHTVVPRAHEGQGLASALARASLEWARDEGLKVVPRCSFYAGYMKRHPETHDLLDRESARALGI